jgi:YggT family protein
VIIDLIRLLFSIVSWIIIADVILSWVLAVQRPRWASNPIVRLVQEIAYQILRPFRKLLDRIGLRTGPIDFSPLVAILALQVIEMVLIRILIGIGIG